jgi:broad specificity phosphatase PhoE
VRHAEKCTEGDAKDPELSATGKERTEELARTLARAGVTRLVASEYQRTQATLAPLSARLKLAVDVRPAADLDALATELVSAEPGSVIVVAGHSNTVPALAALLGVALPAVNDTPQGPQLGDDEYDRLFVLYLPPNDAPVKPSVVELRYGK